MIKNKRDMKKILKYIFVGLLGCFMLACQREEMPPATEVFVDSLSITPSYVDAEIVCKIRSSITIEHAVLDLSTEPDLSNAKEVVLTKLPYNEFTATLENLSDGTTYYVRCKISNTWSEIIVDETIEFTTYPISAPVMGTTEMTDLTFNSAIIHSEIIRTGGKEIFRRGVVYGVSTNPTIENATTIEMYDSGAPFSCFLGGLDKNSVYYARPFAANELGVSYGEEVSFSVDTLWSGCDLGLSVNWAHINIGATYPEEAGDYFAWGETKPKTEYTWANYKLCNGSSGRITKYSTRIDSLEVLEAQDDAASVNWGGKWRMPTNGEIRELLEKCKWQWKEINGVAGYMVSSIRHGGQSIFIPVAGHKEGSKLIEYNRYGAYWGNMLIPNTDAGYLRMLPKDYYPTAERMNASRCHGMPVRAVCPK